MPTRQSASQVRPTDGDDEGQDGTDGEHAPHDASLVARAGSMAAAS